MATATGMLFSPGCARGHAANRRRTPALPLKEDCQRHEAMVCCSHCEPAESRRWRKGKGAGARPLPPAAAAATLTNRGGGGGGGGVQRRRRRFLSEPRPRAQWGRLPGRRPASGGLGQGTTCWGITRNQAVQMRAVWGCSRGEAPSGCPPSLPRSSLAPPAGLAVAGPVIWRRTTVVRRRNSEDYEEALAARLASG